MLEAVFEEIQRKRSQDLLNKANQYPRNNPVASDISPCARETALGILHWQDRPPFTEELLARFEVGNDQESLAIAKMLRYGLKIVEQQQNFELRDKKGRLILRGRIDGKVEMNGQRIPFDYKTINPMMFDRLNTIDDFLKHKFFSKYPKQLWAYEYMNNIETGFVWMDNLLGQWKFVEIPMDWGRMEEILSQCETAVKSVEDVRNGKPEEAALPAFHRDPQVCTSCWCFKRLCLPPFASGEGMQVIDDPELGMKLERIKQLEEAHHEYERYDREVKKVFKAVMKPMQTYIIGGYMVSSSEEHQRKGYEVKPTTYMTFEIEKLPF